MTNPAALNQPESIGAMNETPQEKRTEVVGVAVTASELWQVKLVSRTEGRSMSDLAREFSVADLIERGVRLENALREMTPQREKVPA